MDDVKLVAAYRASWRQPRRQGATVRREWAMDRNPSSDDEWYVVHTYSGHENKVRDNIERTIDAPAMSGALRPDPGARPKRWRR